jgi:DNA-binding GntR family transcriptional regulator
MTSDSHMVSEQASRPNSHTAERIAAELRKAIRYHELLPGEHVRQQEWAGRLGVSSGPTREALKVLVAEHLLTYDAHRGYFVARIDAEELTQLYALRRIIEAEVLRTIRWPSEEELEVIAHRVDEVLRYIDEDNRPEAIDAQRVLSFMIFDLSPAKLIVRETKRYWDMAAAYRALAFYPSSGRAVEYFNRLLECLRLQDRDGLIELNSDRRAEVLARVLHS